MPAKKTCLLCHKEFPYQMLIEGKIRKFQHRKYCLQCSPYGSGNNRNLARTEKTCAKCQITLPLGNFYSRGNTRYPYCKECMLEYNKEYRRQIKQQAVEYKGGKCILCGYSKCLAALDFHHRDFSQKELNIAHARLTFEQLKNELDKCDLVCSNCHRELHSK